MYLRLTLVLLVTAERCAAGFDDGAEDWCERVCTGSRPPAAPACPPAPACPAPVCPPPVVNLSCPEPRCPPPKECPACPAPTSLPAAPASPHTPAPFFPYGYVRYSNVGVYKFYPEAMWSEANDTCSADGAHLAVPETGPEVDVILYIMERRNIKKAFIGFHDFFYEGNYMTILGQPMNSFQHSLWGSGEPDGGDKRNVVYLKSDGHIYDFQNTGTYPFICELPMKSVS